MRVIAHKTIPLATVTIRLRLIALSLPTLSTNCEARWIRMNDAPSLYAACSYSILLLIFCVLF